MLPHVKNSEAGRKNYEAHVDSLFKVTFIPPAGVAGGEILTEQVTSCQGWKQPGPEKFTQSFMSARRNHASTDVDATQSVTFEFELNLNNQFQNYVYNTITQWRAKVFNPLTGEKGLKVDYIGKIIVESFAADGTIYWTRTLVNAWPSGSLDSIGQNDYSDGEAVKLSQVFEADYYDENKL